MSRFDEDGQKISGRPSKLSEPLTYPVFSLLGYNIDISNLCIGISSDGSKLVAVGSGSTAAGMTLEWDDDTSTAGVALDSVTIEGIQYYKDNSGTGAQAQKSNNPTIKRSGEKATKSLEIFVPGPGEYPIRYKNLNNSNKPLRPEQLEDEILCPGTGNKTVKFDRHDKERVDDRRTITVTGGTSYGSIFTGNDGGFTVRNNNKRLCFRDTSPGNGCENQDMDIAILISNLEMLLGIQMAD